MFAAKPRFFSRKKSIWVPKGGSPWAPAFVKTDLLGKNSRAQARVNLFFVGKPTVNLYFAIKWTYFAIKWKYFAIQWNFWTRKWKYIVKYENVVTNFKKESVKKYRKRWYAKKLTAGPQKFFFWITMTWCYHDQKINEKTFKKFLIHFLW